MDTCTACHHTLPAWDSDRMICTGCQQAVGEALAGLPGLYAALAERLGPGRSGSSVGSRHGAVGSRPPCALDVVDLRDEVLMTLDSWARALADEAGEHLPERWEPDPVADAARWLRWRLDWAARQFAAADDLVREVCDLHRRAHGRATDEPRERTVWLACPCGGTVPWRVSQDRTRCGACGGEYDREQVAELPLAGRAHAAA